MKVIPSSSVPARTVESGASGTLIRELITDRDEAPTFAMRLFDLAPGGHTPYHTHAWEHEIFALAGEGEIITEDGATRFSAGDAILVMPEEKHQFRNSGKEALRFLCFIPVQRSCVIPSR
jgi:quercetin dioxygenase-like cupin family protein